MELPNETKVCRCGKTMVPCWTFLFQETPTSLGGRWEWWCRCGARIWGGSVTDGDARDRWADANPGIVGVTKTLPPIQPPKPSDRVDGHCAFCRFYKRNELDPEASRCRRYAPITVREVTDGGVCSDRTHFPEMHPEGWCGDFERAIQE